jgi:hypothetical protein
MGHEAGFSPVTKSPGYYPGNDPEADAVRTGRRHAKAVDDLFTGGMGSAEELAWYILDALRKNDRQALLNVEVSFEEFDRIMWLEFPQSRPYCNSNAKDAYFFLHATSLKGISTGLDMWGGKDLDLEGIDYTGGKSVYLNFNLYHEIHLQVRDRETGEPGVIRFVRTFAERRGVWKVYAFKDRN